MPSPNLADVLFNAYHRRILELLLLQPSESFHIREIARRTGVPTGSLHRELKHLTGAGLLRRTRVGNQVHYQVDRGCPVLEELTATFQKLTSYLDGRGKGARVSERAVSQPRSTAGRRVPQAPLRKLNVTQSALAAVCRRHHVNKLSFFGSVTRDDFTPHSDVDVLVEFDPDRPASLTDVVELRDRLSRLFGGRRVDVATKAIMKNPYRREAIQKDLQTAYAAR
jgi:predicted nucleotidyltransferase